MEIKHGKKAIGSVSNWSNNKDFAFARDIDFLLALKLQKKKTMLNIDNQPFRITDVRGRPLQLITLKKIEEKGN